MNRKPQLEPTVVLSIRNFRAEADLSSRRPEAEADDACRSAIAVHLASWWRLNFFR